jgi:HD superfamily phosphohydrolase
MDYLLRDAHYTGVGYSLYDLDWIIYALAIARVRDGDDPDDLVLDYNRGLNALAQFLFGRFYMYAQVYYHKTVRAAEWMFSKIMARFARIAADGPAPPGLPAAAALARGERISVADYLRLDDLRVSCALEDWADGGDAVLSDVARRLVERRLFKAIDVDEGFDREAELAEAAARVLGAERAPSYWAVDRAERQVVAAGQDLVVVGHPGLGTVPLSRLVAELALGRPVTTVRVICAPELVAAFRPIVDR